MASLTKLEELCFLSKWGLLKESAKVLLSHTKLFISLTLTLIVPLCVVGLGHTLITQPITDRINWDEFQLVHRRPSAHKEQRINSDLQKQFSKLFHILAIYIFALFAFSLLSTSAIVYSAACIYTEKITSYKKVLSIVPRVWKRLIVTFLWATIMMVGYAALYWMLFSILVVVVDGLKSHHGIRVVVLVCLVGFFVSTIYLSCVWHLASVVTVLEDGYGLEAMSKSFKLIEGKQFVAFRLFLMYCVMTFLIGQGFRKWVVFGRLCGVPSAAWRAVLGCVLILLLSLVDLMGFLVQTVFYFACKVHHHESIDRLQLSDHLGAYMGEYVPLTGSIQLEDFEAKLKSQEV